MPARTVPAPRIESKTLFLAASNLQPKLKIVAPEGVDTLDLSGITSGSTIYDCDTGALQAQGQILYVTGANGLGLPNVVTGRGISTVYGDDRDNTIHSNTAKGQGFFKLEGGTDQVFAQSGDRVDITDVDNALDTVERAKHVRGRTEKTIGAGAEDAV